MPSAHEVGHQHARGPAEDTLPSLPQASRHMSHQAPAHRDLCTGAMRIGQLSDEGLP